MKANSTALAVSLLSSVLLLNAQAATAQTTSPPSATGDDTAGANLHSERKPAGHHSDHWRSPSRSRGEENERR